ncbi:MOSC domain-containing protein [Neorhizobium sp. NPDC001467]|uniref:MOSC domain-containing protein n=1 Tax=Neorhizobium sp. NPDC001467 TaxID=3390595 RepID=UPI003D04064A
MPTKVDEILLGAVRPFGECGVSSGIDKAPVAGPVELTVNGFVGDGQGDTVHHGGADKAVHHYASEHYHQWREIIGDKDVLRQPGAFGENLSTEGLTEFDVAVGDIFRIGSAILQVSQGRQPCWKLNIRFETDDMARKVQDSGMTGWYYRVLQPGTLKSGDQLDLIDRIAPAWTVHRLWNAFYVDRQNIDELRQISTLSVLPEKWRSYAARRIETRAVEDWTRRLQAQ